MYKEENIAFTASPAFFVEQRVQFLAGLSVFMLFYKNERLHFGEIKKNLYFYFVPKFHETYKSSSNNVPSPRSVLKYVHMEIKA